MNLKLINTISKIINWILWIGGFFNWIFNKYDLFLDFIIFIYGIIIGTLMVLTLRYENIYDNFPFMKTNFKLGISIVILSSFLVSKDFKTIRNLIVLFQFILGIFLIFIGKKYYNKENNNSPLLV